MPCYDNRDDIAGVRESLVDVLNMLCVVCQRLEEEGFEIPVEARKWWEEHKEYDANRLASEKRDKAIQQQQAEEKRKALSKLTAAEKRILGLK